MLNFENVVGTKFGRFKINGGRRLLPLMNRETRADLEPHAVGIRSGSHSAEVGAVSQVISTYIDSWNLESHAV